MCWFLTPTNHNSRLAHGRKHLTQSPSHQPCGNSWTPNNEAKRPLTLWPAVNSVIGRSAKTAAISAVFTSRGNFGFFCLFGGPFATHNEQDLRGPYKWYRIPYLKVYVWILILTHNKLDSYKRIISHLTLIKDLQRRGVLSQGPTKVKISDPLPLNTIHGPKVSLVSIPKGTRALMDKELCI